MRTIFFSLLLSLTLISTSCSKKEETKETVKVDKEVKKIEVKKVEKLIGKAILVKGIVLVKKKDEDKTIKLNKDDELREGDLVHTYKNSSVNILFNDDSMISLIQNSKIKIKQYDFSSKTKKRNVQLNLMSGKVKSWVSKIVSDKKTFKIKTPSLTIGVRGTRFIVSYDDESENLDTEVNVLEGKVAVKKENKKAKVQEKKGKNLAKEKPKTKNLLDLIGDEYVLVDEDGKEVKKKKIQAEKIKNLAKEEAEKVENLSKEDSDTEKENILTANKYVKVSKSNTNIDIKEMNKKDIKRVNSDFVELNKDLEKLDENVVSKIKKLDEKFFEDSIEKMDEDIKKEEKEIQKRIDEDNKKMIKNVNKNARKMIKKVRKLEKENKKMVNKNAKETVKMIEKADKENKKTVNKNAKETTKTIEKADKETKKSVNKNARETENDINKNIKDMNNFINDLSQDDNSLDDEMDDIKNDF